MAEPLSATEGDPTRYLAGDTVIVPFSVTAPTRARLTSPSPTRLSSTSRASMPFARVPVSPRRASVPFRGMPVTTAGFSGMRNPAMPFSPAPGPPADQVLDEAHEFGRLEGLGEEGVDTDVEAGLDLVLRTRADDGEGHVMRTRIRAEPGGGAQAVQPGHDDIEGHDIRPYLVHHIQALGTIGRGHDLEPFKLEVDPDQLADDLVVVHNKHPARRA
jgi:hypothetical protein